MKLEDFGYNEWVEKRRVENNLKDFDLGRVVAEHKERYTVITEKGEYDAEITGNLRFSASGREDFPAVGDWVALTLYEPDFAVIHAIIPRFSLLTRQAVSQYGEVQVIAANIDFAFLVQAADRDFNLNRLERYLTLCHASKVAPVILLTKTDLIARSSLDEMIGHIHQRIKEVPVYAISNETMEGYEAIRGVFEKGKTWCMLGSSGVGKSTLVNHLSGRHLMETGSISQSTGKGRHITSHRELILLEGGGILIDNPGMREVGIVDSSDGLETTFDIIGRLSQRCKYKDCTHTQEAGCAVVEAVENGTLARDVLENFHKMQREKSYFETSVFEKRKKERIFGKILKDYQDRDVKGKGK